MKCGSTLTRLSRVNGKRMIRIAVKMYRPRKVWALCSGGNDSLCSTHLAMSMGLCDGVASINATIGIQETRDHLTNVCERFGWPLAWLFPPKTYTEICAKFGMPGPGMHPMIYAWLKERCVRQLVKDGKRLKSDKVMLITGVRLSESDRRMGSAETTHRQGSQLWIAPIVNWDAEDQAVYMLDNAIPRNPVKSVIGISGECCCGVFAKPRGAREDSRSVSGS